MKRSTKHILTTHAGRLDGPPELRAAMGEIMMGQSSNLEALKPKVKAGMTEIVRQQAETGIDVISDGELGKLGFGLAYYGKRLSGLGKRDLKPGESGWMGHGSGERKEFADFYKELGFMPSPMERAICNGAISYIGQEEVKSDIDLFKSALAESGAKVEEAFMCGSRPAGWNTSFTTNITRPTKNTCSRWPTR
jgi:5-methyltetrahydropteroyltriglutamate--homocysteine methyltransferase